MEEQELKQEIRESIEKLESLEDKKENQEEIFKIFHRWKILLKDEEKFKEIYIKVDNGDIFKGKENAEKIAMKYLVNSNKNWIKYKNDNKLNK